MMRKAKRPPSRAGKGRRLNTPRLILISAAMSTITEIATFASIRLTKRPPIAIGPQRLFTASLRSEGIFGVIIFFARLPRSSNVIAD
jgi:hypothetical protein